MSGSTSFFRCEYSFEAEFFAILAVGCKYGCGCRGSSIASIGGGTPQLFRKLEVMDREWSNVPLKTSADPSSISLLQGGVMEGHLAADMEGHLAADMEVHLAAATVAAMAALLNMVGDPPTLTEGGRVIMAVDIGAPSRMGEGPQPYGGEYRQQQEVRLWLLFWR
jgi:hypothetical protein